MSRDGAGPSASNLQKGLLNDCMHIHSDYYVTRDEPCHAQHNNVQPTTGTLFSARTKANGIVTSLYSVGTPTSTSRMQRHQQCLATAEPSSCCFSSREFRRSYCRVQLSGQQKMFQLARTPCRLRLLHSRHKAPLLRATAQTVPRHQVMQRCVACMSAALAHQMQHSHQTSSITSNRQLLRSNCCCRLLTAITLPGTHIQKQRQEQQQLHLPGPSTSRPAVTTQSQTG